MAGREARGQGLILTKSIRLRLRFPCRHIMHVCTREKLARRSVGGRRQLGMPSGLRLFAPGPFSGLGFQSLPALNETQPEGPVAGIACCSGEAAAFIGTPPEFI
jgi:hypothetical protein